MKIIPVLILAFLATAVFTIDLPDCAVDSAACDDHPVSLAFRDMYGGSFTEETQQNMVLARILGHMNGNSVKKSNSNVNCDAILRHVGFKLISKSTEYFKLQDDFYNNCRELGCTDAQYLAGVSELIGDNFVPTGEFLLTSGNQSINATGINNLIGVFYSIRLINGGEQRYVGGQILDCDDNLHYTVTSPTLAVTLPLNPITRQPLGVMNFILSVARMSFVSQRFGGDVKLSQIWEDQRGLYQLANLTVPWTVSQIPPLIV